MIRRLRDRHRRLILVTALLTALVLAWALLSPARAESASARLESPSR
jgi:4-amino-4-deoxy-L-arabinose transferase-like glycosyltransferase